jgi:hypothetical protein
MFKTEEDDRGVGVWGIWICFELRIFGRGSGGGRFDSTLDLLARVEQPQPIDEENRRFVIELIWFGSGSRA